MRYETIDYSTITFAFDQLIRELFEHNDLYTIHTLDKNDYPVFEVSKDSRTIMHNTFYNKYRDGWEEFDYLYEKFIKEVIAPTYSEDFLYQRKVTMRFHIPNNVCVGAFHRDLDFNHPAGEANFIFPLTFANSTASVWVESERGKEDYEPIPLRPGKLVKFFGNYLSHGSKINKTGLTRVSFDFRALKFSDYKEHEAKESVTTRTKFKIGEYYSLFKK